MRNVPLDTRIHCHTVGDESLQALYWNWQPTKLKTAQKKILGYREHSKVSPECKKNTKTRLTSNLRPTTRECVHLVTGGHFRSRDKDSGHTITTPLGGWSDSTLWPLMTAMHVTWNKRIDWPSEWLVTCQTSMCVCISFIFCFVWLHGSLNRGRLTGLLTVRKSLIKASHDAI